MKILPPFPKLSITLGVESTAKFEWNFHSFQALPHGKCRFCLKRLKKQGGLKSGMPLFHYKEKLNINLYKSNDR